MTRFSGLMNVIKLFPLRSTDVRRSRVDHGTLRNVVSQTFYISILTAGGYLIKNQNSVFFFQISIKSKHVIVCPIRLNVMDRVKKHAKIHKIPTKF